MSKGSRRAVGLTVAWVIVAATMATFAWQAVSAAGSRVNQQPLYPLSAGAPDLEQSVVVVPLDTTTTTKSLASTFVVDSTSFDDVDTTGPTTPSTSSSVLSTSTTAPSSSTSSATSTSTSTSTTTTSTTTTTTAAMKRASYTLVGGTVTIEYGNGQVVLISAVPKAGFATEIDSDGPTEVDLDFRSATHRSKLDAKMVNGALVVDTEEKADN